MPRQVCNRDFGGFGVLFTQTVPLRDCHTVLTYYLMTQGRQPCLQACHTPLHCHHKYMSVSTTTLVIGIPASVNTVVATVNPVSDSMGVCGK